LIGLVLTLAAAGAHLLRLWEPLERQSIDWRFASAPGRERSLSDDIRFVYIDDGALDSVGAWPWPRNILGDAIDELRHAGAAVVALDILFEEAKQADEDQALADAFARLPVVLAVRVGEDASFSEWMTGPGSVTTELLERVGSDIRNADPVKIASDLGLPVDLRTRLAARPIQFKKMAAWRVLSGMLARDTLPQDFSEFERIVAPAQGDNDGAYTEERMLTSLWDQFQAWSRLRRFALPGRTTRSSHVVAPLRILAEKAAMCGVVNPELDADGRQRWIKPVWSTPVGLCLQFGFAAAAKYTNLPLGQVDLLGDRIVVGGDSWWLEDGHVWIDWPTSGWSWDEPGFDASSTRQVSIGLLVSLAKLRRDLLRLEADHTAVVREIAERMGFADPLKDGGPDQATLAQIRDEAAVQVAAADEAEKASPLTEEEQAIVAPFRHFQLLEQSLANGREDFADAERRMKAFQNKLVFVGWTATGALADFVTTPLHPRTPGVMVHAVMADMMLSGRGMVRMSPYAELGLLVTLGLAGSLIAARLGSIWSVTIEAVLLGIYLVVTIWLFIDHNTLAPMVGPLATSMTAWLGATTFIAGFNQRERQRITRQFRSRVSSQLVDHLVHNPQAVSMAGDQREMTVVFADLAGFTSISERLGGPATVSTLNRFMSALTGVLVERGAYLNKFLGDGLMAFWSAFALDAEQAAAACVAAEECQAAVERLNQSTHAEMGVRLSLRVGIATGVVVVGDCGSPPNLNDYTVIGDSVNLAARLESANKQFGTCTLIEGRTHALAGRAADRYIPLGKVVVVGQSNPVELYGRLSVEVDSATRALLTAAVLAFSARDRDAALSLWTQLAASSPQLRLCEPYLAALADTAAPFDGILRLIAK
jgi:CHASE2 domain-containing sensor protein/class 3 adenylate cyclase